MRLWFGWRTNLLSEFLSSLNIIEQVFCGLAIFGGTIFGISSVLQLLGAGDSGNVDGGTGDAAAADGDGGAELGFKVLSIQSVGAFSLVSGSTGLAVSKELDFSAPTSLLASLVAGVLILWLMSLIFKAFNRFSSNGALDYSQALLETGEVYLTLPKEGTGLVQLPIQGRLVTANARSLNGTPIPTGTEVMVREVDHDDTLVVTSVFAEDRGQSSLTPLSAESPRDSSLYTAEYQPDEGEI